MPGVTFTTRGALGKSALRQANQRLVLDAVRRAPGISRADIVRLTGLSPSSVTFIVTRLLEEGLLQETANGSGPAQIGRQPTPLRIQADARIAVAVEVTRPQSRIAVADLEGRILRTRCVPWNPAPEVLFRKLNQAILRAVNGYSADRVIGVGVALAGTLDRKAGIIIAAENYGWYGVEAAALLRGDFPAPFYLENESKLAAQAELWFAQGERQPLRNFAFVNPIEGLGVGAIVEGSLLQGALGAGSEFGHIMLYPDGKQCACGNRGCWERYASGAALAERHAAKTREDAREPDTIVELARTGDTAAREALFETAQELGLGVVNLVAALNPEALIFGGYAAAGWDLIEDILWKTVRGRTPQYFLSGLRMYPSHHGEKAPLMGAVATVLANFFTQFDQPHSVVSMRS